MTAFETLVADARLAQAEERLAEVEQRAADLERERDALLILLEAAGVAV